MQGVIGTLFAERDPADSLANGRVRDFGGGVSGPDEVISSIGCEAGLSRLVAVNGIREYSLEKVIAISL